MMMTLQGAERPGAGLCISSNEERLSCFQILIVMVVSRLEWAGQSGVVSLRRRCEEAHGTQRPITNGNFGVQ